MNLDPSTGLGWGINPFKETSRQKFETLFPGDQFINQFYQNVTELPLRQSSLNIHSPGGQPLSFSARLAVSEPYLTPSTSPLGYQITDLEVHPTSPFNDSHGYLDPSKLLMSRDSILPGDASMFIELISFPSDPHKSFQTNSSGTPARVSDSGFDNSNTPGSDNLIESFGLANQRTLPDTDFKTPQPTSNLRLSEAQRQTSDSINFPKSPESPTPLKRHPKPHQKELTSVKTFDLKKLSEELDVEDFKGDDRKFSSKFKKPTQKNSNSTTPPSPKSALPRNSSEHFNSPDKTPTGVKNFPPLTPVSVEDKPKPGRPTLPDESSSSSSTTQINNSIQNQSNFSIPKASPLTHGRSSPIQSIQHLKPSTIYPASRASLLSSVSNLKNQHSLVNQPRHSKPEFNNPFTPSVNIMEEFSEHVLMRNIPSLLPEDLTNDQFKADNKNSPSSGDFTCKNIQTDLFSNIQSLNSGSINSNPFQIGSNSNLNFNFMATTPQLPILDRDLEEFLMKQDAYNLFLNNSHLLQSDYNKFDVNDDLGSMYPTSVNGYHLNDNESIFSNDSFDLNLNNFQNAYHYPVPSNNFDLTITPKNISTGTFKDEPKNLFHSLDQENFPKLNQNSLGLNLSPTPSEFNTSIRFSYSKSTSNQPSDNLTSFKGPQAPDKIKRSSVYNKRKNSSIVDNSNHLKEMSKGSLSSVTDPIGSHKNDEKRFKLSISGDLSSRKSSIFVNFTSKDSKRLLSGVAPSGSSKRKK
ncbi:expressed protein [Phakopsora pachyrhizi]|uniref:Expressed protein n=1 Tax=Phakopsora pachyrhizi TaxID=170000 RepID=A0AAV0AD39_PHAPC|nr:expressed protein [Phakopsora pachyrhizi]